MEDKNSIDDLIGTSGQPIVVQNSGNDKKFLYIIIALLIVLFIIALGIIAFIGGKYFGISNSENSAKVAQVQTTTNTQKAVEKPQIVKQEEKKEAEQKQVDKQIEQKVVKQNETQASDINDINELEKIVQEQEQPKNQVAQTQVSSKEQKTIAKAASVATGGKALSQEELAKIAQLVAQELAKVKAKETKATNTVSKSESTTKDEELVASLQSAQTDTLKSEQINTQTLKDTKVNSSGSAKKVDTFNKVIVQEKSGGDDEIAKLSAEIDSILQSEEVTKKEKSLKYGKELNQEIKSREREMRFIVVKPGDTLSSLALKAYGRSSAYTKIYKANPDLIKNPNKIYVGMRIRVPVDEEYLKQQGN